MILLRTDPFSTFLEWDGGGNFRAWNIYGPGADEILERYHVTACHIRYHHDAHGNVIAVLNGAGTFLERYTYDAFGKPTVMDYYSGTVRGDTSGHGNRFVFQGREWIPELGIYDYRHRMYDPALGRFLQTDPMGVQTEGEKLSAGQKALFLARRLCPRSIQQLRNESLPLLRRRSGG